MKYSAVFIDVDGTLVPPNSPQLPSERTREAIQKAMARGVYVGLATARPLQQCTHIIEYLGLKGPSVFSGGAEIFDTETNRALRELTLTPPQLEAVLDEIKHLHRSSYWIQDNGTDCVPDSSYIPNKPYVVVAPDVPLTVAASILDEWHLIEGVVALRASGSNSNVVNIHVAHADATKQRGVEYVTSLLSLSETEVIGIGDGYNDVLLMNACGLKAAMADSVEDLLDVATYVTGSVEDDGVAEVIEKFILTE